MEEYAVEIRNVTKSFTVPVSKGSYFHKNTEKKVLDGLDLAVRKGEIVGILGGNGSGKSTLLKMVSGILAPTSGEVITNGKVASILELSVGFHDDLTGVENIYIRAKLYNIPKKVIDERLPEIIEYADIGDYIYSPVRTYSSGMRSRLAFAIMINVDADIFVIDEALSVGDSKFTMKTSGFMKSLMLKGKTVLVTSHSTYTLNSICSRAVILKDGKIALDGVPEEVCTVYDTIDLGTEENVLLNAEYGIPLAEYRMSKLCARDGDAEKSADWLMKAAYSGNLSAMTEYADANLKKDDKETAARFLLMAAKRRDRTAMWKYSALQAGFEEEKLTETMKTLAEKGDHFDAYRYAEYLRITARSEEDLERAYDAYLSASVLGNLDAKYRAALMRLNGTGTEIDIPGAVKELEELGGYGHIKAMTDLARLYIDGRYVTPDKEKGFKWTLALANAGIPEMQFFVAVLYASGIGTPQNTDEANAWFGRYTISSLESPVMGASDSSRISEFKLPMDTFKINSILVKGYSPRALTENLRVMTDTRKVKHPDRVFELAKQAAYTGGQPQAFLADCYYRGIGTEADPAKAFKLFHVAADSGSPKAMMTIALMYMYGVGTPKDMQMFERYIRMAAKRDNTVAVNVLETWKKSTQARLKKIADPRKTNRRRNRRSGGKTR